VSVRRGAVGIIKKYKTHTHILPRNDRVYGRGRLRKKGVNEKSNSEKC